MSGLSRVEARFHLGPIKLGRKPGGKLDSKIIIEPHLVGFNHFGMYDLEGDPIFEKHERDVLFLRKDVVLIDSCADQRCLTLAESGRCKDLAADPRAKILIQNQINSDPTTRKIIQWSS